MFEESNFLPAGLSAVSKSMKFVRREHMLYATGRGGLSILTKPDGTTVTPIDKVSQMMAIAEIRRWDTVNKIIAEENRTAPDDGSDGWMVDPLDGTSAFTLGLPTSTVIIAYRENGRIRGCFIGQPTTGLILGRSVRGELALWRLTASGQTMYIGYRTVWDGAMTESSTVFLDVSNGFDGKTTDSGMARLFASLNAKVSLKIPGSNGLIQSLVAQGYEEAVGSITTAIGGAWDVAGVLLVLAAGGVASAFKVDGHELVEVDPLLIGQYDILVCANNDTTLSFLNNAVKGCLP